MTDEENDWTPIALEREWHIGNDGEIHYMVDPGDGLCSKVELGEPKIKHAIVDAWNGLEDRGERIAALQAENERLRDLLERGADLTTLQEVEIGAWDIWESEVRAALAGRGK